MNSDNSPIFQTVADCEDPAKLRRIMGNARKRSAHAVYDAAFQRLVTILPSAIKGAVAKNVWRTIYASEVLHTEEKKKTFRHTRTRQAIRRKGEVQTVADLVLKSKPSDGFKMLEERGLLKLSFEAIVVFQKDSFEPEVVKKAYARLEEAGADIGSILDYWRTS